MRIFIIGSKGFIGKSLVSKFQHLKYEVIGCDLYDAINVEYTYYKISRFNPEYEEIFQEHEIDVCINAAGNGSVPVSFETPYHDFEANCLDTFKILESLRKHSMGTKYIYISSAAVYGNPAHLPVSELDEIKPLSPYGWHKYYGELMCREYHHLYNINTTIVRPFSVYGPGLRKQLLWDLYKRSRKSTEITLFGTGQETRDFIYIDDLVNAIYLIATKSAFEAEVYNLANGEEIKIKQLAALYFEALDEQHQVSFNNQVRKGDPNNWKADVKKIKALGYSPYITLEEGIRNTVKWQKESDSV